MTEDEFWRATLREVERRVDVWRSLEKRRDFRVGVICSTLANIHRDPKVRQHPFVPADFMPGEKVERPGMSLEQWHDWARSMKAFYGG